MIASPGRTVTDAEVSSRAPPVTPSASPQVIAIATVSPGPAPAWCTMALTTTHGSRRIILKRHW